MSYAAIDGRIAAGQLVVIDGGIGTELERRGVPMDKASWSATTNLEQSDVLEQIHVDYVEAENSSGFHADQESARILAESIDFSRKGQLSLRAVAAAAP